MNDLRTLAEAAEVIRAKRDWDTWHRESDVPDAYIAAASPDRILALLDRNAVLQAVADAARALLDAEDSFSWVIDGNEAQAQHERRMRNVAALRDALDRLEEPK